MGPPRWLSLLAVLLFTQSAGAADELVIGYLELEGDPRYFEERTEALYQLQPWGRPYPGAELALKEARFAASTAGVNLRLERRGMADTAALIATVKAMHGQGVRLFLLDLPGEAVQALARETAGDELLLFNVSALDDALRQEACQPHLLHVAPSRRMLADALAQYLVAQKWRRILVLRGPRPEDKAIFAAFEQSAKRYGLQIVDTRAFELGRDPRQRSRNNVALLTSGAEYDVVLVTDADGEFARAVPYQTQKPRVVAGSAGLVADWWHWASERYGAPQLNGRFRELAGRRMTGYDWSAWMAVKAIAEALLRTQGAAFAPLADYLRSDQLVLDGFKGSRLSFRAWNNQLRQPLFVATPDWVITLAPIEGFLHQRNTLDTLGYDQPESRCRF